MNEVNRSFRRALGFGILLSCVITTAGVIYGCGGGGSTGGIDPCVIPGPTQTVVEYAATCADIEVTGVHIPSFDCDDIEAGTLVPTENEDAGYCDRPNVLNGECDHGSTFHVLVKTPEAFVVAHCRKKGLGTGQYGDIAIIQHNQVTGATCFYQAYPEYGDAGTTLSHTVTTPEGSDAGDAGPYPWMSPLEIQQNDGFRCVTCHDNGPLIRSPYLARLAELPGSDETHRLPGTTDSDTDWKKTGFNSESKPYSFAGTDFQSWRVQSLQIPASSCNGCHRIGMGSVLGGYSFTSAGFPRGTAGTLGEVATRATQSSKNAFDPITSPLWYHYMTGDPDAGYVDAAHDDAILFQNCAQRIAVGLDASDGCTPTEYGRGDTCTGM